MKHTDTIRRLGAAVLLLLGVMSGEVHAQTTPNWVQGYVPPPSEWNNLWASKADVTNGVLTNPTINGIIGGTALSAIIGTSAGQIAYGVGNGLGGDPTLTYNSATGVLSAQTVAATSGILDLASGSSITSNATLLRLNTSHGIPFQVYDNNATVANGIEFQTGSNAANPSEFTMQSGATGGIQWAMPFEVTVPPISAIGNAAGLAGNFTSTFNGQTGNTAQYGLFTINPTLASGFVSSAPLFVLNLPVGTQAGASLVSAGGFAVNFNEAGAPAALAQWVTGTVYAKGMLVQNSGKMYGAQNAGTSGASAPTCGSGTCSDGTVTWLYSGLVGSYMTLAGGQAYATSSFNDGGTSTAGIGNLFGFLFGFTANSGATFKNQFVGMEGDCDDEAGAASLISACIQVVKIGAAQGSNIDTAVIVSARSGTPWNNPLLFSNATAANGVLIEAEDQNGNGGLQTMAGAFDCVLCSPTGFNNFTDGHLGSGGGGYILRAPNSQILGSGDAQIGYTLFHISASGLTIDTSYEQLTGVVYASGGTNWTNNERAYDPYGNQGTVAASGGVPSAVTVIATTFIPSTSVPGSAVNWCPAGASTSYLSTAGAAMVPSCFTATETYTAEKTLGIGGAATLISLGNASGVPLHVASAQTTAPALTSCGTGSPAIAGSDTAGTVTMGTSATGCTITFNVAYTSAPHCNVTWRATPLLSQSYAISPTAVTLTQTSTSSDVVDYECFAPAGG